MALSFFADKSHPPSEKDLARCLGRTSSLWRRIRTDVAGQVEGLTEEWGFSSQSTGWGLRLKDGKRVILYLTPRRGEFLASLALGEKAVRSASGMPAGLRRLLDAAPRYAEGRGVRIVVGKASDARWIPKLVALKLG